MLQIKRLNFTNLLNAQITAVCAHAEHAETPVVANSLYELAEDLNRIAGNIHKRNLAEVLNRPLPNGRPPGNEPDSDPQVQPEPAAKPTPPPPPLHKDATLRQAILYHIEHHPGSTAMQIATALEHAYRSTANECKALKDFGKVRTEGKRPIRYFIA